LKTRDNYACPFCNSSNICKVYWGFPAKPKWQFKAVEWRCDYCKKKWGIEDDFHE